MLEAPEGFDENIGKRGVLLRLTHAVLNVGSRPAFV